MHSALISQIKHVSRTGTCASMLPDVYRSAHMVVSDNVAKCALKWRKMEGLTALRPAVPSSSLPPFKLMTLTVQGPNGPSVFWILREKGGGVCVVSFGDGYMIKIGVYWPGVSDIRVEQGSDTGWLNAALASADDEEKINVITAVAWIIATLNTPGLVTMQASRPNAVQRQKVRKLFGQAALAWTNVDVVPGAVHPAMRNEAPDTGRVVALHRRRGNFAWVPSQRQTAKSVWLTSTEAPRRGAGWYVWREERMVGDQSAGVKAQRHLVHMPGEKRPDLAISEEHDQDVRQAALGALQRAMMVEAGFVSSGTLH